MSMLLIQSPITSHQLFSIGRKFALTLEKKRRPSYKINKYFAVCLRCQILIFTGISNFDLLGAFGRQDWLANFYLILAYNIIFGAAATACLVQKFSASMRQAIYNKIKHAILGDSVENRPHSSSMSDSRYFDQNRALIFTIVDVTMLIADQ